MNSAVIVAGGTGVYNLLWDDGSAGNVVTTFNAGYHTLTVTDAVGCSVDTSITIGSPLVDGCTDPLACNYDGLATNDDGTCEYTSCATTCNGDPITGLFVTGEWWQYLSPVPILGTTFSFKIRCAILPAIVVVLPVPAPASINNGFKGYLIASI